MLPICELSSRTRAIWGRLMRIPRRFLQVDGGGWAAAAIAGLILGSAVTGWFLRTFNRPIPPAVQRLSIVPPQDSPVLFGWFPGSSLAISPDGTRVAYVGAGKKGPLLFARSLEDSAVRAVAGTDGAVQPFFSPDGKWIAFFTETELKKVSLAGGNPITLVSKLDGAGWSFGDWGENNAIVFNVGSGELRQVSADGGKIRPVTSVTKSDRESHFQPSLLPGAKAALFSVWSPLTQGDPRIEAVMLETGERKVVVENAYYPHYLRSGHLLFQRGDTILIAPLDIKQLRLTGPAVSLVDEVRRDGGVTQDRNAQLAVSWNGTLAYIPAIDRRSKVMGWVDRNGKFQAIGLPPNSFEYPRLSPDGKQLAFELQRGQEYDVHVYDLKRGWTIRLTQTGSDQRPAWRPNGNELAVFSTKRDTPGIYLKKLDGPERLLMSAKNASDLLRPGSWSPDGKLLAYTVQNGSQHDIWILSIDADKPAARPYLNSASSEHSPMFSPDGHWLAYVSDESGRQEVYVRRFPEGEKITVSNEGGSGPVWRRDGKELFYDSMTESSSKVCGVSVELKNNTILPGSPITLFDSGQADAAGLVYDGSSNWGPNSDIGLDGRFIMVKGVNPLNTREIVLVQNWLSSR